MRYWYIHFLAASFLIVGMAVTMVGRWVRDMNEYRRLCIRNFDEEMTLYIKL